LGDKKGTFTTPAGAGVELWQVLPPEDSTSAADAVDPSKVDVIPLANLTAAAPIFTPSEPIRLPLGSSLALASTLVRVPRLAPPAPQAAALGGVSAGSDKDDDGQDRWDVSDEAAATSASAAAGTTTDTAAAATTGPQYKTMWCRKTAWPTELLFRATVPWRDGPASVKPKPGLDTPLAAEAASAASKTKVGKKKGAAAPTRTSSAGASTAAAAATPMVVCQGHRFDIRAAVRACNRRLAANAAAAEAEDEE
jgi:hypothetical protein